MPAVRTAINAAPPRPDPSAALTQAYDTIRATRMAGIPILNDMLRVEAIGFSRWQQFWLGVLVTPWCMNLVLAPADVARWPALRIGEKSPHRFPAGRFEFICGREPLIGAGVHGETLMCSLFSPMFEFADHDGARDTAAACLAALFDEGNLEAAELAIGAAPVTLQQDAAASAARLERAAAAHAAPGAADASKRNFLRGRWQPSP